ncbi:MAG: hypothetical protein V5A44_06115, partial [Haloarculaceae archaeon]
LAGRVLRAGAAPPGRGDVAMNLVLSGLFSTIVVWGLAFIGVGEFTWPNVAVATVALFVITWVFVMRG